MTTEPRQEAERLVNRAVVQTTTDERRTLLNAVLAAAIEETDAEDSVERLRGNPRRHGKRAAATRLANARAARRAALSALREDET